jgi:hypothetical protein
MRVIAVLGLVAIVAGCSDALKASEVAPDYVPTSQHQGMSCRQLRAEAEAEKARTPALEKAVDKAYQLDKNLEAVTWILFWPAALALDGNDSGAQKLAEAKGRVDAIGTEIRAKGCDV